jgi:NADPH:quinone reductase-like Zn-dependent oxidoreductase
MRAAVCVRGGGPEALEIRELPVPAVREGWSLVRVKGAGLNRSELRTRQGYSPNVTFPRVLGIVAAHRYVEDGQAAGELVMVPGGLAERQLRPGITRRRRSRKG